MNFSIVKTIFRKELLDTFRDRRTLIAMIGIPVILYPILFIVVTQVVLLQRSKVEEQTSRVAFMDDETSSVRDWLTEDSYIDVNGADDPMVALSEGNLDAVVHVDDEAEALFEAGGTLPVIIHFDVTETRSREAADRIEDVLIEKRDTELARRLSEANLEPEFARPISVERDNIASSSKATGSILGLILPLMMILMLGVGAFYPAVDLTAGEKERGTFETLLSTPISKMEIITGKFVAVFGLCLLTGLLNLASMFATMMFQLSQIAEQTKDDAEMTLGFIEVPPQTIIVIAIILVPLAFFISSVMMGVALLARSFKEAQNYVTPFFIAMILPAAYGALPEVQLSETSQFIPIANVTLLFRDLLVGQANLEAAFMVFLSTTVYAILGLVFATALFQREEVVLSEQGGMPLTLDRRVYRPAKVPSIGMAFGIFTIVMLLIFYVGSYAQSRDVRSGLLITQYAVILLPILCILSYTKVDLRTALNIRVPRPSAFLGTLLMAPAWMVIAVQIGHWSNLILPMPPELMEQMSQGLFGGVETPLDVAWLLFVIAVSPAICEEVLFRGVLVSGLKERLSPAAVVLVVGILFGLFHLNVYRLIPTAASGIFFSYLAVRSGSIFLPMICHFVLNGLAVLLETESVPSQVIEFLERTGVEENGLNMFTFTGAVLVFAVGVAILESSIRYRRLH